MADNLVTLDLTRFTPADIEKIDRLQTKVRMMRRWCRCEQVEQDGQEAFILYSGDRGPKPYATYRINRLQDGRYALRDGRDDTPIADGRTIDRVIDALPDDFYFTKYLT